MRKKKQAEDRQFVPKTCSVVILTLRLPLTGKSLIASITQHECLEETRLLLPNFTNHSGANSWLLL